MKTLTTFFSNPNNASYCKSSYKTLTNITGLKAETIKKFKKTEFFQNLNKTYRNSLNTTN